MDAIILRGVKTHNLKNIDLILPHKRLYVVTGVSGSGKSSLAFDTLYAEGQRRYVESLSAYSRQFLERMEKPEADSVSGIPPAIAIEAKNVVTNARSTVGTQTEINDYLRVLFARIGKTFCPQCRQEVMSWDAQSVFGFLLKQHPLADARVLFRIPIAVKSRKYLKDFFSELKRQGFVDFFVEGKVAGSEELLIKKKSLAEIDVIVDQIKISPEQKKRFTDSLESAFRLGKGRIQIVAGTRTLQFSEGLSCISCGRSFKEPAPNLFSFNSPLGACPVCQGFGRVITIDWDLVIPDKNKALQEGAIAPWSKPSAAWEFKHLLKFCKARKISAEKPWKDLSKPHQDLILFGSPEILEDEFFCVQSYFKYLEKKTYKMHVRIFLSKYRNFIPCETCRETRLKPEALNVRIAAKHIAAIQDMSLGAMADFFETLPMSEAERERSEPVYLEIRRRLRFLNEVGLSYLSLSRLSRTLSGGEVQRIHLATSLGSALVDTLYVLDEPSIGLHERDNDLLIHLLKELRDLGNTIVVVEHDKTMIEAADEVIDIGPFGGDRGGRVIFQGSVENLKKSENSLTGRYLSGCVEIQRRVRMPDPAKECQNLKIRGASEHNLKNINTDIPLGQFVVITGVSGSGKSTLVYDVLYNNYLRYRGRPVQNVGAVKSIQGFEHLDEIILVDQSPIGRTPRSNPATYLKAYDEIRKMFARTPQARRHGFEAGHFSFNVDGGRCEVCKGDGRIKVEMHFLADIFVPCEACGARRFKQAVLDVRCQGKNIDDVLGMSIDETILFFNREKALVQKLEILQKVGLGYLKLGQSAATLSGGESQRLKLASEMREKSAVRTLYLFDEPTTGLHDHDIHYLMAALEQLLERGHSLVIIEHNMEVIRSADYLIDLGPEGGDRGGEIVYAGPRQGIVKCPSSHTGRFLLKHLERFNQKMTPELSR